MSSDSENKRSGSGTETAAESESRRDSRETPSDPGPESPGVEEGAGQDGGSGEERLSEEIRQELQELEELRDRHLRLAAEFDNYRKRTRREMVEQRERAQADLIRDLLEVLDDLGRVADAPPDSTSTSSLREGVEMVTRKFRKTLEEAGLSRVDAEDELFDPQVHEALTSVPAAHPEQDGRVAEVLTEGYLLGDRLLRPARVAVYQYDGEKAEGAERDPSAGGSGGHREAATDQDD